MHWAESRKFIVNLILTATMHVDYFQWKSKDFKWLREGVFSNKRIFQQKKGLWELHIQTIGIARIPYSGAFLAGRKWKNPYFDKRGLETNLLSWQPYPNRNMFNLVDWLCLQCLNQFGQINPKICMIYNTISNLWPHIMTSHTWQKCIEFHVTLEIHKSRFISRWSRFISRDSLINRWSRKVIVSRDCKKY